jgi:hypothetical protein
MKVQGVVIGISLETDVVKNGGGTYKGWELIYKAEDGKVATIAKPIQSFKFNATLKTSLSKLNNGDKFTLEQEKNAAGFFEVKTVNLGWESDVVQPPQQTTSPTAPKGGNYQSSSYPTADERAKTQSQIVRQSCLAQANATLATQGNGASFDTVTELAEQYVAWVKNEKIGIDAIIDMDDDIPE